MNLQEFNIKYPTSDGQPFSNDIFNEITHMYGDTMLFSKRLRLSVAISKLIDEFIADMRSIRE